MSSSSTVSGYSALQILLHWLIFILIAFQLFFGESMGEAFEAIEEGGTLNTDQTLSSNLHIYFGIAILVLAVFRLVLRITRGAPAAPAGTSVLQARIAASVHHLFYMLLFLAPISGLIAWYVYPEAGDIHSLSKPVFIVLIALHVLGALHHQFIIKDGTLRRMFVPSK